MYTLFTLFREYTYIHTIEGRRGVERLVYPSVVLCPKCFAVGLYAPLKESGGRSDVSDPKRTFRLHPERRPPYGQTSTNQFLFEKAIFNDAFHDIVNDAVNDARLVTPTPVPLGIQQERFEFFVHG